MHKVQRPSESAGHNAPQNKEPFPPLDDVTAELFVNHAAAKLRTAPPVVKAEVKGMVPSGPPLGEPRRSAKNGPEPSATRPSASLHG